MLSRANRMVDSADFRRAIRGGCRGATRHLVVHYATDQSGNAPLVGFVAAKRQLPLAVDRKLVQRRLRHLMRAQVGQMRPGALAVIRILGEARTASYAQLSSSLNRALVRAGALPLTKGGETK